MGVGIGKVSKATGCNIETIRYYERIGMISDPGRSGGGHRVYGQEHVERLRFIKRARELGFGLDDIRDLLALSQENENGCSSAQNITKVHLQKTREKIKDLERLEQVLSDLSRQCENSNDGCPVLNSLTSK